MRLDNYLVENNFFSTRNKAQQAIKSKRVKVNNVVITKSGFDVLNKDLIEIEEIDYEFVSRGGYKLLKAIHEFDLDFKDKVIIDLGASTGGFTDCSIKFGAKKVYAIDVGTNQLHESLKSNNKIFSYENTNIKNIDTSLFNDIDFILMDVSFISVTKLILKLNELLKDDVKLILLIKPQFEVENNNINRNGLVKNKDVHFSIINKIINSFGEYNIYLNNLTYSPLRGEKSGNIEYLALFSKSKEDKKINIMDIINDAYKNLL